MRNLVLHVEPVEMDALKYDEIRFCSRPTEEENRMTRILSLFMRKYVL